eukprot:GHVS01078398.1.p1 GENE.GHVS01078398.1~~GHVS01078398.1.p1  ORF type:complete len:488 (+),score=74.56 GHVS01078398.1:57-1520(+)
MADDQEGAMLPPSRLPAIKRHPPLPPSSGQRQQTRLREEDGHLPAVAEEVCLHHQRVCWTSKPRDGADNDEWLEEGNRADPTNMEMPGASQWANYYDMCLDVPLTSSFSPSAGRRGPSSSVADQTPPTECVDCTTDVFRVYVCASPNPAATDAVVSNITEKKVTPEQLSPHGAEVADSSIGRIGGVAAPGRPLLVLLHGGGHSAMSWALVAERMRPHLFVAAFDLRGHGESRCACEENLAIDVLVDDATRLINHVFYNLSDYVRRCERSQGDSQNISMRLLGPPRGIDPTCNGIVLVGHSMGGALAGHLAASGRIPNVLGLVVVDAVEGTAIEALPVMRTFVRRLPRSFASPACAVRWALDSKTLLNAQSARLSIPSQLTQRANDQTWTWRCDLAATEPHWRGWFTGLSGAFLSARCPKMLVLAGHDRLDKQLMIAHMQGKFQLQVVLQSGHVIMEDQPEEVTQVLLDFARRYKLLGVCCYSTGGLQ